MLAVLISCYLLVFFIQPETFIPITLLLSGVALRIYLRGRIPEDQTVDAEEARSMLFWVAAGYVGILVAGIAVESFLIPRQMYMACMAVSRTASLLLVVILAVAEELFFRGACMDFAWHHSGSPLLAIVFSSALFTVFHFAVYGAMPNTLVFIFIAGLILGWIGVKTGRISTTMIVHLANNIGVVLRWG